MNFSNATRPVPRRTLEEKKAVSDYVWETNSLPAKEGKGNKNWKKEKNVSFVILAKAMMIKISSNEDDESS